MSDSMREWPSERQISRESLMKTIENLTVSNERLEQSKVKIAEQMFDSVGCFMDSEPMTVELALQCVRQKWAERDAWEDSATQRITALMAEIEQWKTWGIIEIAVRNPNVASYMEHWEGRATKAEESLSRKEYYDSMRSREIDMDQIPESQKIFVSALLNQRDDSHRKMEESKQENDKLRFLIAKGDGDCIYCGLPKKDMAKCAHGFPGCGRADDLMEDTDGPQSKTL